MSKQSSDNSIYGTGRSGILWYFLEGSKKFFLLSILCSIVTSFLDLISPRLVGVTVDLITGEFHEDSSAVLRALLAKLGGASYVREHLAVIAFVVILLALLGALFRYWYQVLNSMGAETLVERMRNSLFSHLERIRFSWYGENRTGDLIQRCTSDVETVKEFLSEQLTSVFRIILLIILSLYFMFRLNPKLAVLSAVFVPVIFLYSMMFFRKIGETFLVADEEEGNLSSIAQENLTGVRVVRAFGRERMEREKFRAQNDIYTKAYMKLSILISFFWSAGDFISGKQVMLVVVLGAVQVVRGHMTAGDYIAFISYNAILTWPVRSLGRVVSQMSRAGVSVDRIRYIMDAPEESADGMQPEDDLPMDIQFHNVTFSYVEGREKLKDISLSIPAGTTFGILGGTGSGKSTLVALLDRFYELPRENGTITIGGMDIRDLPLPWLRRHLGVVLQEPYLFSRSIGENITLGSEHSSKEDLARACRIACLDETIEKFQKGLDTMVGERGVTLSGGQKQRTAIAQSVIRTPPILIFDDSLSAVDAETDARIRKYLREELNDQTVILISHRISTLMVADNIAVLHQGSILQQGTHEELYRTPGLYRDICEIQSVGEEAAV